MNYYRAIGAFDARIDGFDSAKVIGEISKMLGYDNQLYFSALFRKKYGVCPTEYRKATERII